MKIEGGVSPIDVTACSFILKQHHYQSFYVINIGNFNIDDEVILIHSVTGGVQKIKEQYLIDSYGSFITCIYSSRNKNYVIQIYKSKSNQLYGTNWLIQWI
ncbi:hypothetical protein ACTFIZ_009210 [Dictyostelium cf. discoideum]